MLEKDIEKDLVRAVKDLGGLALKFISPGNRGVPDRIVLLPPGRVYFVELKAPGRPYGPLQRWWRDKLRVLGFKVYKIDSAAGVAEFIAEVRT